MYLLLFTWRVIGEKKSWCVHDSIEKFSVMRDWYPSPTPLPPSTHSSPTEEIGISWGVGGSGRAKSFKKFMKLTCNRKTGGGEGCFLGKNPSIGEVWILFGANIIGPSRTYLKFCFKDVLTFLFYIYYSLKQAKFPTHLLPVVVKPDAVAGKLQRPFYNIPVGTPVGVGLGDFQCSVLASMSQQSDAGDVNSYKGSTTSQCLGNKGVHTPPWWRGQKHRERECVCELSLNVIITVMFQKIWTSDQYLTQSWAHKWASPLPPYVNVFCQS